MKRLRLATSLVLAVGALFLFAALWIVGCPGWAEALGIPCDLLIGTVYFAICPGVSLLAVIFSARDAVHRGRRLQALAAFGISAGLLGWLWWNPPH